MLPSKNPSLYESETIRPAAEEKGPVTFLEWTSRGRRGEFNATMRIPEGGTVTAKVGRVTSLWRPAFEHLSFQEEAIIVARADIKPLLQRLKGAAVPLRFKGGMGLGGTTYSLRVSSEWVSLFTVWWNFAPEPWREVIEVYELATSLLGPATDDWPRCLRPGAQKASP
ncbi:MAG: hypothetical protein KUG77_07260 [Nannocystaceae bacterium]|nr:hypothetical protein [Nannocystaceae bacterium]